MKEQFYSKAECMAFFGTLMQDSDILFQKLSSGSLINFYRDFLYHGKEESYEEYLGILKDFNELSGNVFPVEENSSPEDFEMKIISEMDDYSLFNYLLGLAAYDIFSMNFRVISHEGKIYDLGSLRESGVFIAEFLNLHFEKSNLQFSGMHFYMGTSQYQMNIDLQIFYEYLLNLLKRRRCDIKYYPIEANANSESKIITAYRNVFNKSPIGYS